MNPLTAPPELTELLRLVDDAGPRLESKVLCEVEAGGQRLPVLALMLGNPSPALPAVGLFGGVHGLERIGAEVVLAFLRSLVGRLAWDGLLHHQLEQMRLVVVPIVNPGGLLLGTRANPRGVDLMRNAPVDAERGAPWLVGGQRLSAGLPWYRGVAGAPLEAESAALVALVERELLPRRFSIAVDCHSGFGVHDRLWFPYAHTARPIHHLPEMHALSEMLDRTLTHHRYIFEPQSRQYLAHGDLWDHLYQRALAPMADGGERTFLPLTLEMGSWLWVKKNPRQLFTRHGIFNPLIAHRQQRVLRRHLAWLDFVARAACSHRAWLPGPDERVQHKELALKRWYREGRR